MGPAYEAGNLERTDGIDEKGRRIREGWASPRRVRFFANAIRKMAQVQHPLDKEGKGMAMAERIRYK
jgi:hypothetical protein